MQKNDYGGVEFLYMLFCIMFILIGLTIVAASGNLLILRFVETNSKRCQDERYELEQRRRQQVRIIGDVISSNGRLVTLEDDEDMPPLLTPIGAQRIIMDNSASDLSLCSCRAQSPLSLCIPKSCKKKFNRKCEDKLTNSTKKLLAKCPTSASRTLREEILDELETKKETDENIALQRSYLQLDKIQKRSSI